MTDDASGVGEALGRRLFAEHFSPLPAIGDAGELLGTEYWRLRHGTVEKLSVRPSGLALASITWAEHSWATPALHGEVIEHLFGAAGTTLTWLLSTSATPPPRTIRRPPPGPGFSPHLPLSGEDGQ
jgi:hypothetical protein